MDSNGHRATKEFLEYLAFQKRYSPHTIISYQNDLFSFFDFIFIQYGPTVLSDIKTTFIRTWLASLKEASLESKSINRKISSLKSFFKYQLRQQVISVSPMTTIVSPKLNKRLPQFVAQKDINMLFQQVSFPDDWEGKTSMLILHVFYNTGMRKSELVGLRESQIDLANSTIKVLGKGNKERIIPAGNDLMARLKDYMAEKRKVFDAFDAAVLFINGKGKKLYPKYVYNLVKKYLGMVTTINQKSPHILRHTFATHLMNNGAELNAVKELLGHTSLAATQIYTHNSIEKLKDIHKKAHPKA
jgi:integrase/recombinase XerC